MRKPILLLVVLLVVFHPVFADVDYTPPNFDYTVDPTSVECDGPAGSCSDSSTGYSAYDPAINAMRWYGVVGLGIYGVCRNNGREVQALNSVGWDGCLQPTSGYMKGTTSYVTRFEGVYVDYGFVQSWAGAYSSGELIYESWVRHYCDGSDPVAIRPPNQPG